MLKKITLAAGTALFACAMPVAAQTETAKTAAPAAPIDPARLAIAQKTVGKLIPSGTYKRMMKDMMDGMAGSFIQQMMGMDASALAKAAGAKEGGDDTKGKTFGELAAEKDPQFKERMDITMKVLFTEMGSLMNDMEPVVRDALSNIYARKYSVKELTDMYAFFATPSGAAFASNFMATFTDKEMIDASFGMMPKVLEAMPEIMKKVEAATAHLPPLPKSETELAADAAADGLAEAAADSYVNETGEEPWYNEESWTPAQRKKVAALSAKSEAASEKQSLAYDSYSSEYDKAVAAARDKLKADYDRMIKEEPPMAAEDIPANAPPPPVLPKT
jgi:Uncharacterized protein conserved in bacteria (DUF2059)